MHGLEEHGVDLAVVDVITLGVHQRGFDLGDFLRDQSILPPFAERLGDVSGRLANGSGCRGSRSAAAGKPLEQRVGILKISRVEALREPLVRWGK